jgi:hypothetical protein
MPKERIMQTKRVLAKGVAAVIAAAAGALAIGGAESAGFFKEATGFDSAGAFAESAPSRRSGSNGRTDVIKAQGNTKWGHIE